MLNGTTTGLGPAVPAFGTDHQTGHSPTAQLVQASGSGSVVVPGTGALLGGAEYSRSGSDLVIHGPQGEEIVVRDYFATDHPPQLVAASGASLDGDVVARLAGPRAPAQSAQATGGQTDAASEMIGIGKVKSVKGEVVVKHPDGTTSVLKEGDVVYQDDVIETGANSAVGLVLADKSTFSLGAKGRMVLDEMIYDPNAGDGKSAIAVLSGTFSFVSGQIAKANPDGMQIKTPVATLGIRGTTGHGAVEGENTSVALVADGDGQVGEIIVTNSSGVSVLNQPLMMSTINSAFQPPSPPVFISASSLTSMFGDAMSSLPNPSQLSPRDLPPAATQGSGPVQLPQLQQQQNDNAPTDPLLQQGQTGNTSDNTAQANGQGTPADGQSTPISVNSNSSLSSTLDPKPSLDKLLGTVIGSKDPVVNPAQGTTKPLQSGSSNTSGETGQSQTGSLSPIVTAPQTSSTKSPSTGSSNDNSQTGIGSGKDTAQAGSGSSGQGTPPSTGSSSSNSSGSNTDTSTPPPTPSSRSGTLLDPYIGGATVWLDSNNNGQLDAGEWRAVTGPAGYFVLTDSAGGSLDGVLRTSGGIDSGSGAAVSWSMSAPVGSTVITPLTTLVQTLVESGKSQQDAIANVEAVLGLNGSRNILTTDPLSVLYSNPTNAQADSMVRAGIAVSNLISVGVAAFTAAGATPAAAQAAMLGALANLTSGGGTNALTNALSASGSLNSLLSNAASRAGTTLDPSFRADLAAALESINGFAMNPSNPLVDAVKAANVAQAGLTADITALGGGATSLGSLASYTSGLSTALAGVSVGQLTPTLSGTTGDDTFVASGLGGAAYYGRSGNDTITGTAYKDRLYGEDGNDIISGGNGDDLLDGGDGNDTLDGGAGNDIYFGGAGNDTIITGAGEDTVMFSGTTYGNDTINASGIDGLTLKYDAGGPGIADITEYSDGGVFVQITYKDGSVTKIDNLTYIEQIKGIYDASTKTTQTIGSSDAYDIYVGWETDDFITVSVPNRTVFAGGGNDTVEGSNGKDTLFGGYGNDTLKGNAGNDVLNGGSGNDSLDGGADDDTLTGGSGNDIFKISRGNDVITDFVRGQDKIDVRDYFATFIGEGSGPDITSFAAIQSRMGQNANGDAVITFTDYGGQAHTLTIKGVSKAALTAEDFLIPSPRIAAQNVVSGSNIAIKDVAIGTGSEVTVRLIEGLDASSLDLNVGDSGVTVEYLSNTSLKISGTTAQINAALAQTEKTGLVLRNASGSNGAVELVVTGGETSRGSIALVNNDINYFSGAEGTDATLGINWSKPTSPLSNGYFASKDGVVGAGKTLSLDTVDVTEEGTLTLNGRLITTGDNTVDSLSTLTINGGGSLWGYGTTTVTGALHLNSTIDVGNPANTKLGGIVGVSNTVRMEGTTLTLADQFTLQGHLQLAAPTTVDLSGKTLTGGGVLELNNSNGKVTVSTANASFDGSLIVSDGTFSIGAGRTMTAGDVEINRSGTSPGRIEIAGGGTLTASQDELVNSGYLRTLGAGTAVINAQHGYDDRSKSLLQAGATTTVLDFGKGSISAEGIIEIVSNATLVLKGGGFDLAEGDIELPPGRLIGTGTLDGSQLNSFVLSGTIRPGDYVDTEMFPTIVQDYGVLGMKGDTWFTEDTVVEAKASGGSTDALKFDGGLHLAGTLRMTFDAPPVGPINFISATAGGLTDTLSGTFNLLDFRGIGSGLLIDPAYNATTKTLTLTAITADIGNTTSRGGADYVWNDSGDGDFAIAGADVVYGNAGDDRFRISTSDTSFHLLDGGDGADTLKINGGGTTIDLSNLIGRVQGMDIIDISDTNAGKLTILDAATVRSFNAGVDISGPNPVHSSRNPISGDRDALFVVGDANDTLHLKDPSAWTSKGAMAYTVNGVTQMYRHYTADAGETHLYVAESVTVDNLTYTPTTYSVSLPSAFSMVNGAETALAVSTAGLSSLSPSQTLTLRVSVSDGTLSLVDDLAQTRHASSGTDVSLHNKTPAQIEAILQTLQYHAASSPGTNTVTITLTNAAGISTASYVSITTQPLQDLTWDGTGDGSSLNDAQNWGAASISSTSRLTIGSADGSYQMASGATLTVDSLTVNGSGQPENPTLGLHGALTIKGTANASSFNGELLDLTGGTLTLHGKGAHAFSIDSAAAVSSGSSSVGGNGHLNVTGSLTLQNATLNSSLYLLDISSSGGDLYLHNSTIALSGAASLDVTANSGNDALSGVAHVSATNTLSIGAGAGVDISGKLYLDDNARLNIGGAGDFEFSAINPSAHAVLRLGNGSTLDVTGYNTAHSGQALHVDDTRISINSSFGSATLRGDYIFGNRTELVVDVMHDGGTANNTYFLDGSVAFKGADLRLQLNPSLSDDTITALDVSGSMTSLWKDIHFSGVDDTQLFRPYMDGHDLKVDIITSGITTTNLATEDANANYVYAESGADLFYVKGADVIFANDGNDQLFIRDSNGSNPAFSFLDGGTGTNTMLLEATDNTYNLNAYAPWVQNIDAVVMNKSGTAEQVGLNADTVRSFLGDKPTSDLASIDNALIIRGDGEDTVNLYSATGTGWSSASTPELAGYTGYTSTDSAGVEVHLYVQNGVTVQQLMSA